MGRRSVCVLALLLSTVTARAQEPQRGDGWVVLTLDAYRDLRTRAFPGPATPLPPPVDAALTRIDYTLRAGADTATGEARLTVDVLKQGWVDVRIPAGLVVRAARLDGRPVALLPGNPPRVLISRAGRFVLTLDVVVPITSANGSESMTLAPSGSALAAVSLAVPRAGVDFASSGGVVVEQSETPAETRWMVYGTASQPLTFTWKRRSEDRRAALPLRTRATVTQLISLGDEVSHVTASVTTEVLQGSARQALLSVPEGVSINQVSGATVADWQHQQGVLTVSFLEPITSTTTFIVSGETRLPRDGTIAIPMIRSPGAEREIGGVGVDIAGAGEIGERQPRGIAIEGEVFQAGAVKVPLIAGATVVDARMAGQPLPLIAEQNTLAALLTGPRTFAIAPPWAGIGLGAKHARLQFDEIAWRMVKRQARSRHRQTYGREIETRDALRFPRRAALKVDQLDRKDGRIFTGASLLQREQQIALR
jgi:hypothetical protein